MIHFDYHCIKMQIKESLQVIFGSYIFCHNERKYIGKRGTVSVSHVLYHDIAYNKPLSLRDFETLLYCNSQQTFRNTCTAYVSVVMMHKTVISIRSEPRLGEQHHEGNFNHNFVERKGHSENTRVVNPFKSSNSSTWKCKTQLATTQDIISSCYRL